MSQFIRAYTHEMLRMCDVDFPFEDLWRRENLPIYQKITSDCKAFRGKVGHKLGRAYQESAKARTEPWQFQYTALHAASDFYWSRNGLDLALAGAGSGFLVREFIPLLRRRELIDAAQALGPQSVELVNGKLVLNYFSKIPKLC